MRYYDDNINENNFLKIILILKLLNIYYTYRKKFHKKSAEYRKVEIDNINTNVNTDDFNEYEENNLKKLQSYNSSYKLYTNAEKLDRNREVEKLKLYVPIIISEKNISIPLKHDIKLEDYIIEVNNMKNQVYLTDSRVLPLILPNNKVNLSEGKLFIEGVVRSTIEYNTVDEIDDNSLSGYIKHTTSFIPFKCTTFINYTQLPIIEYNNSKANKIDCFLKKSEVFISNSYSNQKLMDKTYDFQKIYKGIHQKLILKLTLSLTQMQVITIIKENNTYKR